MALGKKAIEEFKAIYKKEFNEDVSDDEAQKMGQNLIDLFKVIYRPIPEDYIKAFERECQGQSLTRLINSAKIN